MGVDRRVQARAAQNAKLLTVQRHLRDRMLCNNRRFMSLCVGSKKSVEDFGLRRKQYESPYLGRACNDLLGTTQNRIYK